MALSVNTNVSSLTAQRNLSASTARLNGSLERLSTGLRINKAADSASGIVISETQRAQINGLEQSVANIDRAVNFVQTADGALSDVNSLLLNLRQLAVDSANGGAHTSADLTANQTEATNLLATIDSINTRTKFGSLSVFTTNASTFQVGAFQNETEQVTVSSVSTASIGLGTVTLTTQSGASNAITAIDSAIATVSAKRGQLGAFQKNTLTSAQGTVKTQLQNLQEAESTLRDTDFTSEIAKFTSEQIRGQAAQTVLGLANQSAQSIVSLLRG